MSEQPEPPGGWPTVRTDAGARVIVGRLDKLDMVVSDLAAQLATLKESRGELLTWKQAATAAVVVIGAAWVLNLRTEAMARAETDSAKSVAERLEKKLDSFQGDFFKGLVLLESAAVQKRRQPELKALAAEKQPPDEETREAH